MIWDFRFWTKSNQYQNQIFIQMTWNIDFAFWPPKCYALLIWPECPITVWSENDLKWWRHFWTAPNTYGFFLPRPFHWLAVIWCSMGYCERRHSIDLWSFPVWRRFNGASHHILKTGQGNKNLSISPPPRWQTSSRSSHHTYLRISDGNGKC